MVTRNAMDLGKFFQLLYKHGHGQREREIAHDLNNHLSVLSMQTNMIVRALAREDRELALRKSDEIQETAKRIQDYTETLNRHAQQQLSVEKTNLGAVVEETLAFSKFLPDLDSITVQWQAPKTPVFVSCYADGVKLVLLGFLYAVEQVPESSTVQLTLDRTNTGSARITATLGTPPLSGSTLRFTTQTGQSPGATPLRQLMRNLDSEETGFRIELNEGETLSVACVFPLNATI